MPLHKPAPYHMSYCRSESQLQLHLDIARRVGSRQCTERCARQVGVQTREIGDIESIEETGLLAQLESLLDLERFADREIVSL